ncbi:hypothetical protein L218DRAFT_129453 [Marasmius fiardii PR-910]|nr:hypothetical protein L218DRAFT_129453 [Marasmius fiardii PR-910]
MLKVQSYRFGLHTSSRRWRANHNRYRFQVKNENEEQHLLLLFRIRRSPLVIPVRLLGRVSFTRARHYITLPAAVQRSLSCRVEGSKSIPVSLILQQGGSFHSKHNGSPVPSFPSRSLSLLHVYPRRDYLVGDLFSNPRHNQLGRSGFRKKAKGPRFKRRDTHPVL